MRYRWLPHSGRRHAIPDELYPGDEGETLCGDPIVPPRNPWQGNNTWATCWECDRVWREREGLRPWPVTC
ncbi:hypothetical protein Lesp02_77650 [Lentzea sp. NBRC 105346]|uniref:zinc finger protein n=1 Tax=Lentzea sp. NBRC 105346 TaxID=3032205 RepID=UPI0024A03A5F|nr:zinc finger protein [Lentzea sp. NBRC 105346]GLZ35578.1 hypothetical protein Lesp02_77650 [Lentzea sp. NBRC 105346]